MRRVDKAVAEVIIHLLAWPYYGRAGTPSLNTPPLSLGGRDTHLRQWWCSGSSSIRVRILWQVVSVTKAVIFLSGGVWVGIHPRDWYGVCLLCCHCIPPPL